MDIGTRHMDMWIHSFQKKTRFILQQINNMGRIKICKREYVQQGIRGKYKRWATITPSSHPNNSVEPNPPKSQ